MCIAVRGCAVWAWGLMVGALLPEDGGLNKRRAASFTYLMVRSYLCVILILTLWGKLILR